jgi:hypothetical protein
MTSGAPAELGDDGSHLPELTDVCRAATLTAVKHSRRGALAPRRRTLLVEKSVVAEVDIRQQLM